MEIHLTLQQLLLHEASNKIGALRKTSNGVYLSAKLVLKA